MSEEFPVSEGLSKQLGNSTGMEVALEGAIEPVGGQIPPPPIPATDQTLEKDESQVVGDNHLDDYVTHLAEHRWQCKAPECSKLFKSYGYWLMHRERRHPELDNSPKSEEALNEQNNSNETLEKPQDEPNTPPAEQNALGEPGEHGFVDAHSDIDDDDDIKSNGSWQLVTNPNGPFRPRRTYNGPYFTDEDFVEFFAAARSGDIDTFYKGMKRGMSIEARGDDNCTPLAAAINAQQVEMVKFLLEKGADVHHRAQTLPPLAHAACQEKHGVELCKLLIDKGASKATVSGLDEKSPLHWAVTEGRADIVEYLLQQGIDVEAKCARGCSPLILAAEVGSVDCAKVLLEHGASLETKSETGGNVMIWSSCHGRVDAVQFWLDKGVFIDSVDEQNSSALHLASHFGRTEVVKLLLANGANVNTSTPTGITPLMAAICKKNPEIVKMLIDAGCDLKAKTTSGIDALDFALEMNMHLAQIMLTALGGRPSYPSCTVAHQLAMTRDYSSVTAVVNTISVMWPSMYMWLPGEPSYSWLSWVIKEGEWVLKPKLLTHLLRYSLDDKNVPLLKALIREGCDVNELLGSGHTALADAIRNKDVEFIKVLLDAGADPNKIGLIRTATPLRNDLPPLYGAVLQMKDEEDTEIVDLLLATGRCKLNSAEHLSGSVFAFVLSRAQHTGQEKAEALAIRMLDSLKKGEDDKDTSTTFEEDQADLRFQMEKLQIENKLRNLDMDSESPKSDKEEAEQQLRELVEKREADVAVEQWRVIRYDNDRCDEGASLLHVAVDKGNETIMDELLKRGLDIEAKDNYGATPLILACQLAPKMLQPLLGRGADVHVKFLNNSTALHAAAAHDNVQLLDTLLSKGLGINDANDDGFTPLLSALTSRCENAAIYLIEHGADVHRVNAKGETAIILAARHYLLGAAEKLLSMKVDVNVKMNDGWTALQEACQSGSNTIVRDLLDHGADIEQALPDGNRPLHTAILRRGTPTALLLIDRGADITARGDQNRDPLNLAANTNHWVVARKLLELGASTEEVDDMSWTPLCRAGRAEVLELLIEFGANVNYADRDLWTPLHQTVSNGEIECVEALLRAGADLEVRTTDDGLTVMERAHMLKDPRRRRTIIWMLKDALQKKKREEEGDDDALTIWDEERIIELD